MSRLNGVERSTTSDGYLGGHDVDAGDRTAKTSRKSTRRFCSTVATNNFDDDNVVVALNAFSKMIDELNVVANNANRRTSEATMDAILLQAVCDPTRWDVRRTKASYQILNLCLSMR